MIYVMTNTTNPTDYFRTGCPRQAVTVARRWKTLGKKWETIAAIRAAMD